MEKEETLSIIILARNEKANLKRLLPLPHETIVAVGDSTDGSKEVARKRGAKVVAGRPGKARQMNDAAQEARGDILVFLHADTKYPKELPAAIRQARKEGVQAGACETRYATERFIYRLIDLAANIRAKVFHTYYGDHIIWCNREVFAQIREYPEIPLMEDVEFSKKLKENNITTAVLPVKAIVSPRRFEKNGVVAQLLLIIKLRIKHALGIAPEKLAREYHKP